MRCDEGWSSAFFWGTLVTSNPILPNDCATVGLMTSSTQTKSAVVPGEHDAAGGKEGPAAALQIGARVHYARVLKGMRMRDLARKVSCTESMISKIEANRVVPSIPMLQKIIVALDRNMASFFGLELDTHKLVQRPDERVLV